MADPFPQAPPVITDDSDASWLQPRQFPQAPPADSGYWWPHILGGIWNSLKSGAMLPGDVATGQAHTTDPNFAGRVADMTGLVTGGSAVAPAEDGALNMGIRAYHGSPHSFDQFDISKVGTGEGAQAYGHGLYFADSEGVAKNYRDQLAKHNFSVDNLTDEGRQQYDASVARRMSEYEAKYGPPVDNQASSSRSTVMGNQVLNNMPESAFKPTGHMYQVDINADPEHFLDWDKPLSEQGPIGQQVNELFPGKEWTARPSPSGKTAQVIHPGGWVTSGYPGNYSLEKAQQLVDERNATESGLGRMGAGVAHWQAPENVAKLNDAGIPGIKYLDQGSRASGDGSRNYVVFNDALVKVLKKYGLAGAGGAAGASALMNQPQPAQAGQFPQAPPY